MPARVITQEQALAGAARLFHESGALDMDELAVRLAVSRATLYRVVGSRDLLLRDVLWRAGRRTMQAALLSACGAGAERLLEVAARFNADIVSYTPLRRLLEQDPATAFRVLFTAGPGVHRRFVEVWQQLFREAQEAGELPAGLSAYDLAFVFVRIGESVLYADLLAGTPPNLELAAKVQRAVLTGL